MSQEEQEPTFEELLEQLKDEEYQDVRKQAAETLGRLKEQRAVPALLNALNDEFPEVRIQAAKSLAIIGDKRAVEPLITRLQNENEVHDVREEIINSLGELGDAKALEVLVNIMNDEDDDLDWKATEALGKLGEPAVQSLISVLYDEDSSVDWVVADALGNMGEIALKPLLTALHHEDCGIRRTTEIALSILGKPAVEPLILILQTKNEDIDVRKSAASILGEIGDKKAIKPLIRVLQDKDEDVRRHAARVLGKLEDGKALEPLKILLEKENYSYEKSVIQAAIRKIERKVSPFGKEEEKKFILKIIGQLTDENDDKFLNGTNLTQEYVSATNLTREYVNFSMMNTLLDEIEFYEQQYEGIFYHFYYAYIYSNIDSKEIIKQIVKRYSEYLEVCLEKSEMADIGRWKLRIEMWKKYTKEETIEELIHSPNTEFFNVDSVIQELIDYPFKEYHNVDFDVINVVLDYLEKHDVTQAIPVLKNKIEEGQNFKKDFKEEVLQRMEDILIKLEEGEIERKRIIQGKHLTYDELVERLQTGDSWSRKEAAKLLGELGDKNAKRILLDSIYDENLAVRRNVVKSLLLLGENVVNILSKDLDHKDEKIRTKAKELLDKISKKEL